MDEESLLQIGADGADPEFREFAQMFQEEVPLRQVYDIYQKTRPRKAITPAGSVKNREGGQQGVKEFYSREEAARFTRQELDRDPALFASLRRSMGQW